jgi:hypothetical protein
VQRRQGVHDRLLRCGGRVPCHEQHGRLRRWKPLHDRRSLRRRCVHRRAAAQLQRQQQMHDRLLRQLPAPAATTRPAAATANACTIDFCDAALGCGHQTASCDDGDPCTTDTCNTSTGCGHVRITGCVP